MPAGSAASAWSTRGRVAVDGVANCWLKKAAKPFVCTFTISSFVGPKVDWFRNRAASAAEGLSCALVIVVRQKKRVVPKAIARLRRHRNFLMRFEGNGR